MALRLAPAFHVYTRININSIAIYLNFDIGLYKFTTKHVFIFISLENHYKKNIFIRFKKNI